MNTNWFNIRLIKLDRAKPVNLILQSTTPTFNFEKIQLKEKDIPMINIWILLVVFIYL